MVAKRLARLQRLEAAQGVNDDGRASPESEKEHARIMARIQARVAAGVGSAEPALTPDQVRVLLAGLEGDDVYARILRKWYTPGNSI